MRTTLLLLAVLGATGAVAQPVSVAPWMTGHRLVKLAAWPAGARNNFDLTPQQYMDQQLAKMYIEGVHDATEGKGWCYSQLHKPKPGTLQEQAIAGLQAMPPEQLKRAAADLITNLWRMKYPCSDNRSRP